MPIDISFWFDMMADSVVVYSFLGRTVSGQDNYSPGGTKYRAYISMKNHLIIDKQGREILAKGFVVLGTNDVIKVEDKVELPAEYVPRHPPILAVNIMPDGDGNHHTTLEIG